jgi:hypothetical protein
MLSQEPAAPPPNSAPPGPCPGGPDPPGAMLSLAGCHAFACLPAGRLAKACAAAPLRRSSPPLFEPAPGGAGCLRLRTVPASRTRNCCKSHCYTPENGLARAVLPFFRGPRPGKTALALAPGGSAVADVKIGKTKRVVFLPFSDRFLTFCARTLTLSIAFPTFYTVFLPSMASDTSIRLTAISDCGFRIADWQTDPRGPSWSRSDRRGRKGRKGKQLRVRSPPLGLAGRCGVDDTVRKVR